MKKCFVISPIGQEGSDVPTTAAILQGYTPNSGDAWAYTLDSIGRYFDRLLSEPEAATRVARAIPTGQ